MQLYANYLKIQPAKHLLQIKTNLVIYIPVALLFLSRRNDVDVTLKVLALCSSFLNGKSEERIERSGEGEEARATVVLITGKVLRAPRGDWTRK